MIAILEPPIPQTPRKTDSPLIKLHTLAPQALAVLEQELVSKDAGARVAAARAILERTQAPNSIFDLYGQLSNRTPYTLLVYSCWTSGDWDTGPAGPIAPGASSAAWNAVSNSLGELQGWIVYVTEEPYGYSVTCTFDLKSYDSNSFSCTTNIPGAAGRATYTGGWGGNEFYTVEMQ